MVSKPLHALQVLQPSSLPAQPWMGHKSQYCPGTFLGSIHAMQLILIKAEEAGLVHPVEEKAEG